eukprot:180525-Chlamydomonas_euryale.AAC.6
MLLLHRSCLDTLTEYCMLAARQHGFQLYDLQLQIVLPCEHSTYCGTRLLKAACRRTCTSLGQHGLAQMSRSRAPARAARSPAHPLPASVAYAASPAPVNAT